MYGKAAGHATWLETCRYIRTRKGEEVDMLNLAENRKYPRMTIDCSIIYRYVDDDSDRRAVAKNISGNGMLFVADKGLQVGDLLEIKIQPGTLSIPTLDAVVEVVRVHPGDHQESVNIQETYFEVAAMIRSMK
jgi:hypothetical protein